MQKEQSSLPSAEAHRKISVAPELIVAHSGGESRWGSIISAFDEGRVHRCAGMAEVAKLLESRPDGSFVMLYPNPAFALSDTLAGSGTPGAAIEKWNESAAELIALYRHNRRRMNMVDGDAAVASPDEFNMLLAKQLNADLIPKISPTQDAQSIELPRVYLVADAALRRNEKSKLLSDELKASSLPLAWPFDREFEKLSEQILADSTSGQSNEAELEEENELLLLQLRQVQEELEAHFLANGELEKLKQTEQEAREEAQRLQSEHIVPLTEEVKRLNLLVEHLNRQLEWKDKTLASLRSSLSWKVTAPLRAVAGIFMGSSKH